VNKIWWLHNIINIPLKRLELKDVLHQRKQTLKQNGTYLISDIPLPIILLAIKSEQNTKIMDIWGHHNGEH
jgi:hypothetical protein